MIRRERRAPRRGQRRSPRRSPRAATGCGSSRRAACSASVPGGSIRCAARARRDRAVLLDRRRWAASLDMRAARESGAAAPCARARAPARRRSARPPRGARTRAARERSRRAVVARASAAARARRASPSARQWRAARRRARATTRRAPTGTTRARRGRARSSSARSHAGDVSTAARGRSCGPVAATTPRVAPISTTAKYSLRTARARKAAAIPARRLARSRDEHRAGHGAVETVGRGRETRAVRGQEVVGDDGQHGIARAGRPQAGRLVDHEHVVVRVEDAQPRSAA